MTPLVLSCPDAEGSSWWHLYTSTKYCFLSAEVTIMHDKFREVNTREKKSNQRKHVHEHFRLINKNELVEFLLALSGDLFRVTHALQIGMSISIHGLEHHFTPALQGTFPTLLHFLGESKAESLATGQFGS